LRLLLDEHYSVEIARLLVETHGLDAVAVKDSPTLRALADAELWDRARADRRAVLSNNVQDFMPIFNRDVNEGRHNFGLVVTSDRGMPRSRHTIGTFVTALALLMAAHPGDGDLANRVHWLTPSG
jgi:Domain of unknown function (DUF5615)